MNNKTRKTKKALKQYLGGAPMSKVVYPRSCDGCTACCKTHAVDEVNTPAGEWCKHCDIGKGCLIYNKRPLGCKTYACIWLLGKGEKQDRPDQLNIIVDYIGIQFDGERILILNFWEVEEGAMKQHRAEQIMIVNINAGNIVVFRPLKNLYPVYYFPKGMFSQINQHRFIETAEQYPKIFINL